jgi:hypothetical protein
VTFSFLQRDPGQSLSSRLAVQGVDAPGLESLMMLIAGLAPAGFERNGFGHQRLRYESRRPRRGLKLMLSPLPSERVMDGPALDQLNRRPLAIRLEKAQKKFICPPPLEDC